jgi:hypothetical protein
MSQRLAKVLPMDASEVVVCVLYRDEEIRFVRILPVNCVAGESEYDNPIFAPSDVVSGR